MKKMINFIISCLAIGSIIFNLNANDFLINEENLISCMQLMQEEILKSNDPLMISSLKESEKESLEALDKLKSKNPDLSENDILKMFFKFMIFDKKLKSIDGIKYVLLSSIRPPYESAYNKDEVYSGYLAKIKTFLSNPKYLEILKNPNHNGRIISILFETYAERSIDKDKVTKDAEFTLKIDKAFSVIFGSLFGMLLGGLIGLGPSNVIVNPISISSGIILSSLFGSFLLYLGKSSYNNRLKSVKNVDIIKEAIKIIISASEFKISKETANKIQSLALPQDIKDLISKVEIV